MSAEIITILAATTCAGASTTGCTYSGTELYPYDCGLLCGRCADRRDDASMPPVPISSQRAA